MDLPKTIHWTPLEAARRGHGAPRLEDELILKPRMNEKCKESSIYLTFHNYFVKFLTIVIVNL